MEAVHTGTDIKDSLWSRMKRFAVVRAILGVLLLITSMSVVMIAVESLPKSNRILWPSLLAAALMVFAYRWYARQIEHRPGQEFRLANAPKELGLGAVGGAALVAAVFAVLTIFGVFHFEGRHSLDVAALDVLSEMVLVSFFEEILVRGIILPALERPLGSVWAVVLSSMLFGAAHLPNAGATALSTLNATLAGCVFGAAYLATRRLWLGIAMHLGWNFTVGYIFSATVSGHDRTAGLFFGELQGANWLTGGAFGVEGSAVTLVMLALAATMLAGVAHRNGGIHSALPTAI